MGRRIGSLALPVSKSDRMVLVSARQRRGLSQADLGRILKMDRHNICSLEIGKRAPSFGLLAKWCEALDYEVRLEIRPREEMERT